MKRSNFNPFRLSNSLDIFYLQLMLIMLVLPEEAVSRILRGLTVQDATVLLDELRSALASWSTQKSTNCHPPRLQQPHRSSLVNEKGDTVLVMPVTKRLTTGVKVVVVPQAGNINGAITIYGEDGTLQGVLNAAEITAFRTALATMTLLTRWNQPEASRIAVFGSGKQAEWHIRLALLLRPGIRQVTVLNRGASRLTDFSSSVIEDLNDSYPGVKFATVAQENNNQYSDTLRVTLAEADIIFCCTPSIEPLFTYDHLASKPPKARFLSLIGSYKPNMREIDIQTVKCAGQVYVDCKEACLRNSGEIKDAGYGPEKLIEIGDLFCSGAAEGLEPKDELTLFKCVGLGVMDLSISQTLLEIAKKSGAGVPIDSF